MRREDWILWERAGVVDEEDELLLFEEDGCEVLAGVKKFVIGAWKRRRLVFVLSLLLERGWIEAMVAVEMMGSRLMMDVMLMTARFIIVF